MSRKLIALALALFLFAVIPASATISTLASSITLQANGAVIVWDFPMVADQPSDIFIVVTNAEGQQTTPLPSSYSVALNPIQAGNLWSVGGFVTYPLSGSPLPSGSSITISRVLPLDQTTVISNQGNFYPDNVETAIDTSVMQIQQVNARTGQIRGTWIPDTLYNFGDIVVDGANGADTGNLYAAAIPNLSGTWTTDLSNGDWSLALNVQGIVNTLPQINNNNVFGNISGATSQPYGVGVSALIDSAIGNTQGDILYRSGSAWSVLPPGTSGQYLTTEGVSANPQWTSASGSGTVTSIATNNGLTGGTITSSGTIGLAGVASNTLMANTTTGTSPPAATTLSAYLDTVIGNTQGSIIYRGGTTWQELGPGTSGQLLETQGSAANPTYTGSISITNAAMSGTTTTNNLVVTGTCTGCGVTTPSAFAIGSYVIGFYCVAVGGGGAPCTPTAVTAGSTYAGVTPSPNCSSNGSPTGVYVSFNGLCSGATGDSTSGTWRAMQSSTGTGGVLFLRIS